jgi:hypothetical protein
MAVAAGVSEPPIVEQVITEFFAKSLHIILESRSPYDSSRNFIRPSPPSSPLAGSQPRDRWFNLALRDCPAALENFDLWRQSVDAFSERQTLNKNRGGALCTRADGPRAGAGRSAAWCEVRWCSLRRGGLSAAWGRTVRGLVRG